MSLQVLITRFVLGAAVALAAIHAPRGLAQPAALSLTDAAAHAVARNPGLRGAGYLLHAACAREDLATQAPPMMVGVDFEDFAGTDSLRGTGSLQMTMQLSGILEFGHKRGARHSVAEQETDIVVIEQEIRHRDLLARVATRFAEVVSRQEQLARAEIRLVRARIDQGDAENALASARARLAATWGSTSADFGGVVANFFDLPQPKSFDQLKADVESSPAIRIVLARQRLAEAQVNLADARRALDVNWSLGVRRGRAIGDTAWVASVAVPVGTRRRAEPEVREARALLEMSPDELQAARIETSAALFGLHRELEPSRLEFLALRNEVAPRVERVLHSTAQEFNRGRTGFPEYADMQQELLDVRHEIVVAAAEFHVLLIEIERLAGTSLHAAAVARKEGP